jgi:large subunit ribosomal protein L6
MSRIGKNPITIPAGVKVSVQGQRIQVEGPKGSLERTIAPPAQVEVKDNKIIVSRPDDSRKSKAMHGLARTLIKNMVQGVTQGFEKELHIEGVGYRAAVQGQVLNLSLGYSHPVDFQIPKGITIVVDQQTELKISGIDKELVGQVAANIRFLREPEVYRGKGIRYKDEVIRRKAGKTAASGGK